MNKSLKTLFLFNGIFLLGANLLGPLFAVYVQGIDSSILAVSVSWSIFLASTTFFTYLMSKWGDRVKEKEYFLMLGYLLRAVAWIGYIFVNSLEMLFVLQVIIGLGEALGTPSFEAIFAEHLDSHKHILDYSRWKVISNLVGAVATIIGGYVVSIYGFFPLFVTMAVLSLVALLGVLIQPRKLL